MSHPESINLYFTEGSSDKVYQVQLVESDDGWKVNAQNGRRGGTLRPQNKTPEPVTYDAAKRIYDQLVTSKKKDGYTESETGSVYQDTVIEGHFTGVIPQLLNDVREEEAIEQLLSSSEWVAQEKHDGEHRIIRKQNDKVEGINKTGMLVPLPVMVAEEMGNLKASSFTVDGEIIGDNYHIFELLEFNGKDLRELPYEERIIQMETLLLVSGSVSITQTAYTEKEKRSLAARILQENGEGVVFKRKDAKFSAGKPASGGSQRKWKYTESATLEAGQPTTGKRSIALLARDGEGNRIHVGKSTVPPNFEMPKPGELVEIGYLYRNPGDGGCLSQPVYKGVRTDQTDPDNLESLKVKPVPVSAQRRKPTP